MGFWGPEQECILRVILSQKSEATDPGDRPQQREGNEPPTLLTLYSCAQSPSCGNGLELREEVLDYSSLPPNTHTLYSPFPILLDLFLPQI